MQGVFVTGTDSGVGKTTVCAGLLRLIYGSRKVSYWKPIQVATVLGNDARDIIELTDLSNDVIIEPVYRFPEPVAPYLAAKQRGEKIDLDVIMEGFEQRKKIGIFQIIEGTGGILSPLTEKHLQIDLIKRMGLPLLIVGGNKLGVINSTLLVVRTCRNEGIHVLGVVLTKTRKALHKGNAECIVLFGSIDVLAELEETENRMSMVSRVSCDSRLRKLFNVPVLPE